MTPELEKALAEIDPGVIAALEQGAIYPRGFDADGHLIWRRTFLDQGDKTTYTFSTPLLSMKGGYAWVTVFDRLYGAGWTAGVEGTRREIRRALGVQAYVSPRREKDA